MSTARALKRIISRFEQIKASAALFDEDTTLEIVDTNIQLLEDEWKEYHCVENVIGESDAYEQTQNLVEDLYFKTKKVLVQASKELGVEASDQSRNISMFELMANQQSFLHEVSVLNQRESEVRLPRINIPYFSGKYSEFPSFKDLFEASIDSNVKISKVHKFQYLKGLLKDEAAALVRHIEVTDANYTEAWEKIKARYDKKKLVISTLIKHFVDQPVITKVSAKALHQMADTSDEVLRGLRVLGAEAEKRDPWLIQLLVNKLDSVSKQAWANETAEEDFPSMERFFKFLNRRSDSLDVIDPYLTTSTSNVRIKTFQTSSINFTCVMCSKDHLLSKCEQFLSLDVSEKRGLVADKKLCFNCLSPSHQAIVCRSKYRCGKCHRRHHSTLHVEDVPKLESRKENSSNLLNISSTSSESIQASHTATSCFQSLLPTAIVKVTDEFGNFQKCRVLLDSGSQASFVTETCMQRLKLPRTKATVTITGLTDGKICSRGAAFINLKSLYSENNNIDIEALIIGQLPSRVPSCSFKLQDSRFLSELQLADPNYNTVGPIDILIGADRFFHILANGRITNSNNSLVAQETLFGWIVSGIPDSESTKQITIQSNHVTLNYQEDVDLDVTLKKFFEQEEIPEVHMSSQEEIECESHYKRNLRRSANGRYIVAIPFKKDAAKLGNSINAAKRRFLSLERKLQANAAIKEEYCRFIDEYQRLGYLTPIEIAENQIEDASCFYLPHHCVIKDSRETTKLRVVFDGSARSTTGISLNETMLVGPTIQPSLWSILLKFRSYRIALIGDVEKMYNQVMIADRDTQFQRILWRNEPTNEIKHYKLNTITFGLASSSFLAIRTLQQIAYDNKQDNEEIVSHIINEFYVDDFISGGDTVEEVQKLKEEICRVLKTGGFKLRKFKSNSSELMAKEDSNQISTFQNSSETTILGLQWNSVEDIFSFKLTLNDREKATKRQIISEYSRVFDPLGWLSPSIIQMKIIFQSLWLRKLGWDDELPNDILITYNKIRSELKLIEKIKIYRYVPQAGKIELHGFSDASEKAYSAVVYCRVTDKNGGIKVNLMCSKTKVAPIKQISLPRLELCGAHLLSKLLMKVKQAMQVPVELYAWTDSTIVLMWLSSHPRRWKTYVANRTSEILSDLPRNHWNHVRSEDNPADCASRGVLPSKLISLTQWWQGPEWLHQNKILCSQVYEERNTEKFKEEERKPNNLVVLNTKTENDAINRLIQRFSSYNKLIRVVAYMLRFIGNARKPKDTRIFSFLFVDELRAARDTIIHYVQRECFAYEIDCLQKLKEIRKNSNILSLAPFLDANGILRVGGRLRHSNCQYDVKHPIILPKGHTFSHRVISYLHQKNMHPGPSLTFHLIKQQFWIVGGRSSVRNVINKCVICFKVNAKTSKQLMGDLPVSRLKAARPFTSCGVDYAGPIQISSKKGRGAKIIKGYIAIFVCMVTKAVHIEAVSDMSTDGFIAALKRFVSRRGAPAHIYSDNGSNFIGTKRLLNEIHKTLTSNNHNCIVAEHLAQSHVQWHFIPPGSPHFGGLWEAAIKSVKTHLNKCASNIPLTFEEMATMLSQIEAILNSRPLYATSDDETAEVLTPAHFLIGSTNFYLPEEEICDKTPAGRLTRWQVIQQRVQSFWRKFNIEYFHNLQQRAKWQKAQENFKVGDIVMVKESNLPSYKWALGKIIECHPDDHGLVRVVTLKTSSSTLKRPIVKLCKLPLQENVNDVIVNGPENV